MSNTAIFHSQATSPNDGQKVTLYHEDRSSESATFVKGQEANGAYNYFLDNKGRVIFGSHYWSRRSV